MPEADEPVLARGLTRRELLRAAVRGAAAGSLLWLPACLSGGEDDALLRELRYPTPDRPVAWRIRSSNPPIADGLAPPQGDPLTILNWDGYIAPQVLRDFERAYGVSVEVTTFYDMGEAVSKLRTRAVAPDIFFPTIDVLAKLIVAGYVQPLNHDYLPHLSNVWTPLRSPFYDAGSRYSVPYAIYSTGIGWRNDLIDVDVAAMPNPWDVFWDASLRGRTFILDDYRSALSLVLLREGFDVNTTDPETIHLAQEGLQRLSDLVGVKWSLNDYTFLPEGRAWLHQAWSGDMITAPFYGHGSPAEVAPSISYWFPADHRGLVENDVVVIPRASRNPVLAHAFVDFLLESTNARNNFAWLGYQQPVAGVDEEHAVASFPWLGQPNLSDALVSPDDLARGYRLLTLPPAADELWQTAWLGFRSGA